MRLHGTDMNSTLFSKCLINIADYGVLIMRFGRKIGSFFGQDVLSCWKFERCYRLLLFVLRGDMFDICQHTSFQTSIIGGFKSYSSLQILDFLVILQIIRHKKMCKVLVAPNFTVIKLNLMIIRHQIRT